jgi:hypothetical protein
LVRPIQVCLWVATEHEFIGREEWARNLYGRILGEREFGRRLAGPQVRVSKKSIDIGGSELREATVANKKGNR